jgi:hypothetical protein
LDGERASRGGGKVTEAQKAYIAYQVSIGKGLREIERQAMKFLDKLIELSKQETK